MVRFPEGMRDRLKEAASANGRSMNAEIVARLEVSLEVDAQLADPRAGAEAVKPLIDLVREEFSSKIDAQTQKMDAQAEAFRRLVRELLNRKEIAPPDRERLADIADKLSPPRRATKARRS